METITHSTRRRIGAPALAAAAALGLTAALAFTAAPALAAPAVAAPADNPDVAVTATFDKDTYAVGDDATITVTVTNVGTVKATKVKTTSPAAWQGIEVPAGKFNPAPFDLAPGEPKTFRIEGKISRYAATWGDVEAYFFFGPGGDTTADRDRSNNAAIAHAPVPGPSKGILIVKSVLAQQGVVRTDGPALPDVEFTVRGHYTGAVYQSGRTGQDGTARFTDVPAGRYDVTFTAPSGHRFARDEGRAHVSVSSYELEHRVIMGFVPENPGSSGQVPAEPGKGTGTGSGTDTGAGTGPAAGNGPGQGTGTGTGTGSGQGTGTGAATGPGTGAPAGGAASSPENTAPATAVHAAGGSGGSGGGLPLTGPSMVATAVAGLLALAAGALALVLVRRRRVRFEASQH
ncbi:prealbumin-like fold domain-containing protein [Krasilnikovia sp. MM14-A1004]|uniref:prealbumin-like fold domain-containing protein n=1 Tax=Krasilnikovia sp. MM14-A1004 TaxID=3373541 RepID=UPI00399CE7A0